MNDEDCILIVDDNTDNIRLITDYLRESEFKTAFAKDGTVGLERARLLHPSLILLDIMMPPPDGFETCRNLKSGDDTREIPVIFMTALANVEDKVKAFELGAVDYIVKPVQKEEVLARVRTHLSIQKLRHRLDLQNQLLKEENKRFKILEEAAFEGVALLDGNVVMEVNSRLEGLLGRSREEAVGKALPDFSTPDYRDELEQYLASNRAKPFVADFSRRDGPEIPVEIRQGSMSYRNRAFKVVAFRDLSYQQLLERENQSLKTDLKDRYRFGPLVGKSPAMQKVYEQISKAAATEFSTVVMGETGVGKELTARAIHQLSARKDRAFMPVNCGAIAENLFEAEFFGYRKGAFTGAATDNPGLLDRAHEGVLFLDEISELNVGQQAKLLRVLQDGEYYPVGSRDVKKADVMVVAASNKDLKEMVAQGKMRDDFFFRINVLEIKVPPLRERLDDLPLLIEHFLGKISSEKNAAPLSTEVLHSCRGYQWPGNIRELNNVLQRYIANDQLDLPFDPILFPSSTPAGLFDAVERLEKDMIVDALKRHGWHRERTSSFLKIPRRTLHRKMIKYGLKPSGDI